MKKIIVGTLVALLVFAVGVYAHGGEYKRTEHSMMGDYRSMHQEVESALESGSFQELENLRKEYNMPVLHWVKDTKDFELTKKVHEGVSQKEEFRGCRDNQ